MKDLTSLSRVLTIIIPYYQIFAPKTFTVKKKGATFAGSSFKVNKNVLNSRLFSSVFHSLVLLALTLTVSLSCRRNKNQGLGRSPNSFFPFTVQR